MSRRPSQAGIARALGLTSARVSQLVADGMPTDTIASARQWRDEHIRPLQKSTPGAPVSSLTDARARREAARADLEELSLRKQRGELVDRAGVERAAYQAGRQIQKALVDNLPPKIAQELATKSDPWECECLLRQAIRRELETLSPLPVEDEPHDSAA